MRVFEFSFSFIINGVEYNLMGIRVTYIRVFFTKSNLKLDLYRKN
jgi:hypothetical protein